MEKKDIWNPSRFVYGTYTSFILRFCEVLIEILKYQHFNIWDTIINQIAMKKLIYLAVLFLFISTASAANVFINEPADSYNLGDTLYMNFTVLNSEDASGTVKAFLHCPPEQDIMFFMSTISLQKDTEKYLSSEYPFNSAYGNCNIIVHVQTNSTDIRETKSFLVTDNIIINFTTDKIHYNPNENVIIEGIAKYMNGASASGQLTIGFDKNYSFLTNGTFRYEIGLGKNISGEYQITASIEDQNKNRGIASNKIYIDSIPTSLSIETINETNPGQRLWIYPKLYDQSGKLIEDDCSISISDSSGKIVFELLSKTGRNITYDLPKASKPGDWSVDVYAAGFKKKAIFLMNELAAVEFSISDNILTVENVGNVQFKKPMEIIFKKDGVMNNKIYSLDIAVGQSVQFELSAPSGTYNIEAKSAESRKEFLGVSLTGSAVDVKEKSPFGIDILGAVFVLIIIALIVIFAMETKFQRSIKKHVGKLAGFTKEQIELKENAEKKFKMSEEEKKKIQETFEKYVDKNVAKIVLDHKTKGKKQEVTALFVDIRGFTEMTKDMGEEGIIEILNKYFNVVAKNVYANNGIVNHLAADEVFALFNIPERAGHEMDAIKAAIGIRKSIESLNRESDIKLKAGIGINSGEAMVGNIGADNIMKYTSIGDSINIAQKIEEMARDGQIFITGELYERLKDKIIAEKIGIKPVRGKYYEIYNVKGIKV